MLKWFRFHFFIFLNSLLIVVNNKSNPSPVFELTPTIFQGWDWILSSSKISLISSTDFAFEISCLFATNINKTSWSSASFKSFESSFFDFSKLFESALSITNKTPSLAAK